MCSSAQLRLAARTMPLRQACAVLLASHPWASHICWAARAHAAFHHREALWWGRRRLWKEASLALWMSDVRSVAALSTSSALGFVLKDWLALIPLNSWIQMGFCSGSSRKLVGSVELEKGVGPVGWPVTWSMAWSEPSEPSQSTRRSENVVLQMAASLYHARLMTESHSCSVPHLVIMPGSFARVSRFVAAHSSTLLAHPEHGMPGGDQAGE